jgi:hypothetical protein
MKSLIIGILLLTDVGVAHADTQTAPLVKCLVDGEKQGLSDKNCPAFERALGCQAQLLKIYEGHLNGVKGDIARVKEERSSSRSPKRRELFGKAAHEYELAAAEAEKAVAQSKEGDAILKREKHEAGCY